MDQEKINQTIRNHFGEIISFETSNGRIISYRKAIQEAEQGILDEKTLNQEFL